MIKTKNFWFSILLLNFIFSCSSDSDDTIVTTPVVPEEEKIILKEITVIDENTLKLEWTLTGKNTYQSFQFSRKTSENGTSESLNQENGSTFVKVDSNIPYTPYLDYQVTGYSNNGQSIKSNIVSYKRPNIKLLNIRPTDALFDSDTGSMFIFGSNGNIMKYDAASGSVTKEINTGATLGYSFLGTYGGQKELYVPRNDGWVYVYNPNDLTLTDQINFGSSVTSVVLADNKLYGTTGDISNVSLKCIDRATKQVISTNGSYQFGRIKKIPNTSSSFFFITTNVSPVNLIRFNYNASGAFVNKFEDSYHGDHPLNHRIFEALPTGNGFLTAMEGAIYNTNLVFIGQLPRGNSGLSSFDFDTNNIIAGTDKKSIEFYNLNSYAKVNSISTQRYPFKVFNYGNKVISLSSTNEVAINWSYADPPVNAIVEIFNK
ncbi:hypothetical protein DRF60_03005 [Chryseobacterium elymi]|uniref:Fibronectin type-III domain-containing protein n=1 Tax=Chryseobacterium elymi TaxID=395936 RepID=A0A3D9DPS1_9FLAO|nr:hypothetical protein [Chryseobacterium elymi]REC79967.1 hypothetical protein DRF60_03005 [Chryseobacterium elymi]